MRRTSSTTPQDFDHRHHATSRLTSRPFRANPQQPPRGSGWAAGRGRWLLVAVIALTFVLSSVADAKRRRRPKRRRKPPVTAPDPKPARGQEKNRPQPGLDIRGAQPVPHRPLGRRVEFDALTVFGQTRASGAVYLFERQSKDTGSMVERRTNYRPELKRLLQERSDP